MAHPRVCGENSTYEYATACQMGSSPRVRGKPLGVVALGGQAGLIPACAGKTTRFSRRLGYCPAHPRVCGENPLASCPNSRGRGSSPRVRGKPGQSRYARPCRGLIPACAGKTVAEGVEAVILTAHPRVCGENQRAKSFVPTESGSSPRVRGKRLRF